MKPTERFFEDVLGRLAAAHLARQSENARVRAETEAAASRAGLPFLDASSNDYLGLSATVVSRETLNTLVGVRAGAGASRLIHGTHPPHEALEGELASWVRLQHALLLTSGYAANVGTLAALGSPGSLIVSDALNHASIIDGCRLSRAEVRVVPHLRLDAVEEVLRTTSASARWVVTESYFSMDGDGPDLRALSELCQRYEAGLVVDEAHALGVFGPEGAGRCAEAGVQPAVLIGTLGKAVGVQGAFVAGSWRLREFLWNRARSFVFSTAPSPALSQLALLHVKRARESDALREQLHARSSELRAALQQLEVDVLEGSFGPIVPVLAGGNERALAAARELRTKGILTQAIRPPTVPTGTARLRLTVTATLERSRITFLAQAIAEAVRGGREQEPTDSRPQAPRSRRIVVLGTGTGIGKTRVASALAAALRARGERVLALKPVESGVPAGGPGEDAERLARSAEHPVPEGGWTLRAPISPHLAAEREQRTLEVGAIVDWVRRQELAAADAQGDHMSPYVIVETAGGALSPLSLAQTNFDFASALGPARWILVAPDALGVLHDVKATLEALRARGRTPDYLVLSAARTPDESTGTNAAELARTGAMAPIATLARDDDAGIGSLVEALLSPAE